MTVAGTFYGLGISAGAIVDLVTLGIIEPYSSYQPFTVAYKGGDGIKKGQGFAQMTWHWDLIHFTDRATLRAYVTGLGGSLFMQAPDNEGAWHIWSVNMEWPDKEEDQYATRTRDLDVVFTHLIVS